MSIKIIVNGANGRMGKVTVTALTNQPDLECVATIGHDDDLANAIRDTKADAVVDFTLPSCVFDNAQTIIANNARPVIGTSGLKVDQIGLLRKQCAEQSLGGIIAPNFSLGAVLMMKYAADAAKYLAHAEIIEMHHEKKVDAPSGTATKTAELMATSRDSIAELASDDRARGELYQGIPIHSVRLPGLFAHQEVIFGSTGEVLTIRHDGMSRECMMPGVMMSCRKVMELDHLVYGLDNLL